MAMTTSREGRKFLERHEGVVLRAYRDVAGVWTIGAGLTAASGVIAPKAGMVLTADQAADLLGKALARNYEPAVRAVMPAADQQEFDGALSFHFNTGAIGRASWVKAWAKYDWNGVRAGLLKWVKGGGKVLPGLKARREAEYRVMRLADYGKPVAAPRNVLTASLAVPMSDDEVKALRAALKSLGYPPGDRWPAALAAVTAFQAAQGLTVDGIIGKATLSAVQRRLNARGATAPAAVTTASGAVDAATNGTLPDVIGWAILGAGLLWLAWTAWQYRDVIAAKTHNRLPRLAAWLRSL